MAQADASTAQFWWTVTIGLATLANAVITGSFAAFIGYRQWRIADHKLKLDLYQRRYVVYDLATERYKDPFVPEIAHIDPDPPTPAFIKESQFLFGDEVYGKLKELEHYYIQLGRADFEGSHVEQRLEQTAEYLERLIEDRNNINVQYQNKKGELAQYFLPYLNFRKVGLNERFWPEQIQTVLSRLIIRAQN